MSTNAKSGSNATLKAQSSTALQEKKVLHSCVVPVGTMGRADALLPQLFEHLSSTSTTGIKRACRRGEVLADGRNVTTSTILRPGMKVELVARMASTQAHLLHPRQKQAALTVVYEDEHLACIIKPPGMQCQGSGADSVQGLLPLSLRPTVNVVGTLRKPRHAHRLDLLTGGLVLAAKTQPALQNLSAAFAAPGSIKKRYVAIVKGRLDGEGHIELALEGKAAATRYQAVQHSHSAKWGQLSTVWLWPLTGRTHQLRRHMAAVGTPILGDPRYRGLPRDQQPFVPTALQSSHRPASPEAISSKSNVGCAPTELEATGPPLQPTTPPHPSALHRIVQVCSSDTGGDELSSPSGTMMPPLLNHPVLPLVGDAGENSLEAILSQPSDAMDPETEEDQILKGVSQQGVSKSGDVLSDGSTAVSLCLWAVELRLLHPITGEPMFCQMPEPPLFKAIRNAEMAAS